MTPVNCSNTNCHVRLSMHDDVSFHIAQVQKEMAAKMQTTELPREDWDTWDPMLISEGLFSAANIFRYNMIKYVYLCFIICSVTYMNVTLDGGFDWIFGFVDHLCTQLVITLNFSTFADLHTLQVTRARSLVFSVCYSLH
jgi:hypothetical protein